MGKKAKKKNEAAPEAYKEEVQAKVEEVDALIDDAFDARPTAGLLIDAAEDPEAPGERTFPQAHNFAGTAVSPSSGTSPFVGATSTGHASTLTAGTSPYAATTSPVLAALGERPFGRPSPEQFGVSPPPNPHLGTSPPGRAREESRYGTPPSARPPFPEEIRGGFSRHSPSTSPRLASGLPVRRPSSSHPAGGALKQAFGTSPRNRPSSMPTQYPTFGDPGAYMAQRGYEPKSPNNLCFFDHLQSALFDCPTADPILIECSGNSLAAFKVEQEKLRPCGHLEGFRGTILAAKIIPIASKTDLLVRSRPLLAVAVRGPARPEDELQSSQISEFDPSGGDMEDDRYQTTVEIYSLRERRRLATIYKSPTFPNPHDDESARGSISINTSGRFLTVTFVESGEVFIYEIAQKSDDPFRCIGKTWTSTATPKSRSWSVSSASSEAESDNHFPQNHDIPLLSLSGRWLAIVHPTSPKSTLHGAAESRSVRKPPGVASHAPPSQPSVTCDLDGPHTESMFNRVARDVTQEVIKGAKWVGDQGLQAWKNYWSKPSDGLPPSRGGPMPSVQQFPPTHAHDESRSSVSPALVSILDLTRLAENQEARADIALQPLATFSLPDGCSFLSFSPTGLNMLTASSKGDVQHVWDLMRLATKTSLESNPTVRQVARYTRVTTANIVDVVWSEPRGEKLAILTDRGTVHIHDMPSSAFHWPPIPPVRKSLTAPEKPEEASGRWGSTFSAVAGSAQPFISAVRSNGLSSFSGFNISAAGAGAGAKGGKMIATGLSRSYGAATGTVNTIRHMGDARLHIPGGGGPFAAGAVRWVRVKDIESIAVVGGGRVLVHSVALRKDPKGRKSASVVGLRLADHELPRREPPAGAAFERADGSALEGHWTATAAPSSQRAAAARATSAVHPISQAEIDAGVPVRPRAAERRQVALCAYAALDDAEPWAFGAEIATVAMAEPKVPEEEEEEGRRRRHGFAGEGDDDGAGALGPEAAGPMENVGGLEMEPGPGPEPELAPEPVFEPPVGSKKKKKKKAAAQEASSTIDWA